MKPIERVLAVLRLDEPDRVPHFEWEYHPRMINALTGGGDYFDLIDELDIDAVMVGPQYRIQELGNGLVQTEWGAVRRQAIEGRAIATEDHVLIKNHSDLEKLQSPDPDDPFRYGAIQEAVERFGGKRAIFLQISDVWSYPRDFLGYTNLFFTLIDNPGLVEGIIDKYINHTIKIIQRSAEFGVDVVMSGDDIADNRGPMISPTMWDRIFMPYYRRFVEAIHDAGLYHWKHSDGNMYKLLDSIIEAGSDGIDPVDPLGGMELSVVKARYGNQAAIKGNVDQVNLLTNGSPNEIIEAVKTCIRDAGVGGGYVCSTSNMIHSGVDPDLYRVMVEAIHRYGQYPLDMDLLAPAE